MPETGSAATDLDLISFLKAIPDVRMRRWIRIPAWYLLLVAVLGIYCFAEGWRLERLRKPEGSDLERYSFGEGFAFARRHHAVLGEQLGLELRRPHRIQRFATSSCRWTWWASALLSVIGRSPRSQVVQRISTSWCVTARHCGVRSSPLPVVAW